MLEPARFLCSWYFFSELTHEEAPMQIKDTIITVAA